MAKIKITKDGESTTIIGSLEFAKTAFPGATYEDLTPYSTEEDFEKLHKENSRAWRDSELLRTDSLSLLTDFPKKTELAAYRTKLRDWPSTSDFPDTRPVME